MTWFGIAVCLLLSCGASWLLCKWVSAEAFADWRFILWLGRIGLKFKRAAVAARAAWKEAAK